MLADASLEMLSRLDGRNHSGSAEHGGTYTATGIAIFARPNCDGCQRSTFAANYGRHHQCRRHCCLDRNVAAGGANERRLCNSNRQLRTWSGSAATRALRYRGGATVLVCRSVGGSDPIGACRGRTVAGDAGRGGTVAGGKIMRAIANTSRVILVGLMRLYGLISAASQQSTTSELSATHADAHGARTPRFAYMVDDRRPSRRLAQVRCRIEFG